MAKKKPTFSCSCCKQRVDTTRMKTVFSQLPFDGFFGKATQTYAESFQEIIARYPSFYQWACDTCIRDNKAIKARPEKQFHTFTYPWDAASPYLAYFDINFTCNTCKKDFTFSKEEQKFWYEDLQFVVYSKPVNCKSCRASIREGKNLNTELSQLLQEGQPHDIEQLERIAEIYQQMGKVEKMKAYLKAAQKLKRKKHS